MAANGSLSTLGVPELLQVAALYRKRGSLRFDFESGRVITVYVQEGNMSGVTDSGRVWQLGDLLGCMGKISEEDKKRLLRVSRQRGKRLGQLLLEEQFVSREEMEELLRRLIMQSLLYAVENESSGEFKLSLGPVYETSMTFPIADFLMEITSAVDELERLRGILGPGDGAVALNPTLDLTISMNAVDYRRAEVLAQVEGEKTPMDVAAAGPLSPTETLSVLCELADLGLILWSVHPPAESLAPVLSLRRTAGQDPVTPPQTSDRPQPYEDQDGRIASGRIK